MQISHQDCPNKPKMGSIWVQIGLNLGSIWGNIWLNCHNHIYYGRGGGKIARCPINCPFSEENLTYLKFYVWPYELLERCNIGQTHNFPTRPGKRIVCRTYGTEFSLWGMILDHVGTFCAKYRSLRLWGSYVENNFSVLASLTIENCSKYCQKWRFLSFCSKDRPKHGFKWKKLA